MSFFFNTVLSCAKHALLTQMYYIVVELNTIHHLFQTETLKEGAYFDDPKSVSQIPAFIQHYGLDMSQYEKSDPKDYANFNDFFARKIKPERRPIDSAQDDVSSSLNYSLSPMFPNDTDSAISP